jgi:WAS/WASL-interacting protein
MEFYSKYELIDPLPGEGTRSFRARQIRTGREVTVHLLQGGGVPESEALLARLRALSPRAMTKVIEVGDNEGTTYVATEAPPFLHLAEWLGEQERAALDDALKYTRAGTWKIPTQLEAGAPPAPVPAAPATPVASAPPPAGPGEFTRMFQQSAPVATGQMPAAPAAPAAEPGEFTRLFQQSAPVALPQMPAAAAPAGTPIAPPIAPRSPEQLAATAEMPAMRKAFLDAVQPPPAAREASVAPAATPPAPPAAAPPMPVAGPGEFTRLFQSPLPHAPAQGDWPAQAPAAPPPGEFTRIFQSGPGGTPVGANPIPPAPQQEKQAGEFTRFFQSPGPAATPAAVTPSPFGSAAPSTAPSAPGGFTQMFGKPGAIPPGPVGTPAPPPAPSMMRPQGGGSATQAFSIPVQAPGPMPRAGVPQAPPVPQGPSEYTRMISLGGAGASPGAPTGPGGTPPLTAPPGPGGPQFQMPQMPQMPAAPQMPQMPPMPQAPPMPQFQTPQPPSVQAPAAKAPASNTLLIAIFCVLAFIAGVVVMVLVMKK